MESLSGAKGVTYLMFLHRRKKVTEIEKELIGAEIIQERDTIYGYTEKLEKNGFVTTVGVEKAPGPPKIRTAALEPIYKSIKKHIFRMEPPISTPWSDIREKLYVLFSHVAHVTDRFPSFLKTVLEVNEDKAANLKWKDTLAIFLSFCEKFLGACWAIKTSGRRKIGTSYEQGLRDIKRKYDGIRKWTDIDELSIYKINWLNLYMLYQFIEESKLTDDDISAVGSLMDSPDDMFEDGSFLQRLNYTILKLQRPYLASQAWLQQAICMAAMKKKILNSMAKRYDRRLRDLVPEYGDRTLSELVMDAIEEEKDAEKVTHSN